MADAIRDTTSYTAISLSFLIASFVVAPPFALGWLALCLRAHRGERMSIGGIIAGFRHTRAAIAGTYLYALFIGTVLSFVAGPGYLAWLGLDRLFVMSGDAETIAKYVIGVPAAVAGVAAAIPFMFWGYGVVDRDRRRARGVPV